MMDRRSKTIINAILHKQSFIKTYAPYVVTLSLFVQFISLLGAILMTSPVQINGMVSGPINWFDETLQTNDYISIEASLLVIFLILTICSCLWMQNWMNFNSTLNGHHYYNKLILVTSFLCLLFQLICFPSLIIIIINLYDGDTNLMVRFINLIAIICIGVSIIIEPKRYLYNYLIILICLALFVSINIFLLAFFVLSIYFGYQQMNILKMIVYLELAWVLLLELIATQTDNKIENLYFITISLMIAIYLVSVPRKCNLGEVEENDILLVYIQRLTEQDSLKDQDNRIIYQIIYRFKRKYESNHSQKEVFRRDDFVFCVAVQRSITKQSLTNFLMLKLQINIEKHQFYMLSRMQKLACLIINRKSFMNLTSEIMQLKEQNQLSFTIEQRIAFTDLIVKLQSYFQHPQKSMDSKNMMFIEKQIELFYEQLALVIDKMQFVWHRIKNKTLDELKLREMINQIISAEKKCISIIYKLIPFRKMKMQIDAFNYLMTIINVHYQSDIQWKQTSFESHKKLNHTSYINLVNHSIVDISNSLANETNFIRNELIGKTIHDLFPKKIKDYIPNNIQVLANKDSTRKDIILPLIIDGINGYILPVRSKLDILLDLENGFQYIIQILNSSDLRKLPLFLYSIQSDLITNMTSNFYQYLSLPSLSNGLIQGSELFDIDIGAFISEQEQPIGFTLNCFIKLKKLNRSMKNIHRVYHLQKVHLKLLQLYDTGMQKIVLIQLQLKNRENIGTNATLSQFLSQSHIQMSVSKNRATQRINKRQTFCEIPNRFAVEIDEKLSKSNDPLRLSYVKIIWSLLGLIIAIVLSVLIFTNMKVSAAGSGLSQIMNQSINTNTKIQQIYLLMYQYYQYYQILNYPGQFLAIQVYNMTALNAEYKKKALANVNLLLQQLYSNDLGHSDIPFQLQFQYYSIVDNTSRISIIDLMADTTFAISTNNPQAMVRHEDIIDAIVSSYYPPQLDQISNVVSFSFSVFVASVIVIALLILIIKGCLLHLQSIVWEILDLYQQISPELLVDSEAQLDKYKQVLKQSCLLSKKQSDHFDAVELRHEKQQLQMVNALQEKSELLGSRVPVKAQIKLKLKRQSLLKVLLQHNMIWIVPIILLVFFSFYYYQMQIEKEQMIEIIDYGQNMQNAITLLIVKSEKYFQRAMEGILPVNQRTVIVQERYRKMSKGYYQDNKLPTFFNDFEVQVKQMLGTNLCAYSYLNTGALYKNINCSKILNGIMDTGFEESYTAYFDLVEQNLGISIQDLGKQYRIGATYPVYMQICYQRRTMNNMLATLQGQFNSLVPQYVIQQNNYMAQIANVGFCLLPILFLIAYFYVKQCRELCEFGIKCFQLIPRKFLLKRTTTKLLIKQQTLKKISRFF